ncbi:hypothetical protein OIU76_001100 [Salix suchowensis]|nr:hypothetical protein OIU76_001100 [Salix suchowensis]
MGEEAKQEQAKAEAKTEEKKEENVEAEERRETNRGRKEGRTKATISIRLVCGLALWDVPRRLRGVERELVIDMAQNQVTIKE